MLVPIGLSHLLEKIDQEKIFFVADRFWVIGKKVASVSEVGSSVSAAAATAAAPARNNWLLLSISI